MLERGIALERGIPGLERGERPARALEVAPPASMPLGGPAAKAS